MRKKIIAGNWKMNGLKAEVHALLHSISNNLPKNLSTHCVVFPPSLYLPLASDLVEGTSIELGAQNVHPQVSGAFTGELSPPMLKEFNCRYVLVGHSERRRLFGEDEKFITEKFHSVKDHGMIPILCVGETLEEREKSLTTQVLTKQITSILQDKPHSFTSAVIAYEPVWAIGTGRSASPEQVQDVHGFIRQLMATMNNEIDPQSISILYGGSLNEKNAASLLALPDVDGGLIGGASLDAHKFVEIIACIN